MLLYPLDKQYWRHESYFAPTQDNFTFIKFLDRMWQKVLWDLQGRNLVKVSVFLYDLYEREQIRGTIEVATNETDGTNFIVKLPLSIY